MVVMLRVAALLLCLVALPVAATPTSPPPDTPSGTPTATTTPAAPVVERLTGPVQPFVRGHGELRRRVERFDAMDAAAYAVFHDSLLDLLAAQKAVVGQQLVCRRIRPTGSQIRENVCLTRDEIAARNDDTGDELRKHMQLQQVDYCVAGVCIE
jgi:hypothetical protein